MAIINGSSGDNVITGTGTADIINGKGGDDIISGGGGADIISGGAGDDVIDGGAGADYLQGDGGDDVIRGGAGDDVIEGGRGDDILSGGGGGDTFLFSGNSGDDVITDFTTADTVAIDLGEDYAGAINLSALQFVQAGKHVTINLPNGSSILVQNATIADVQSRVQVACLLRGTFVATPGGEIAVEDLSIGDIVTTLGGAAKRIKWIGKRAYGAGFVRGNKKVVPVLVSAGALGPALPNQDLYVSPDHALYVEGRLVAAEHLVNGKTIRHAEDIETVEYFHVELDAPDVILTNGAPTESYVDHGNRRMFQNYQEFLDLYGEPLADGTVRERRFPVLAGGAELDTLRSRLGAGLAA